MPVNIGVNIQRSPNRINQQLREAGVEGKFPKLLLDFKDEYYLASGGSKTLANAVTHARSGNAVMTDGYGPELVTNGGFDSDSDWTKGTGWSIADGVASKVSGAGTALTQALTLERSVIEVQFTISAYGAGAFQLRFGDNTVQSSYTSAGTYTALLEDNGDSVLRLYGNSSFIGSIDNVSVREMPVLKWAPHNLLQYSEEFDNAGWSKTSTTVTANTATAPDGTNTADTLSHTADGASFFQQVTISEVAHTVSVFVKKVDHRWFRIAADTGSVWFDLDNGVVGTVNAQLNTPKIESVGNDWYRLEVSNDAPSSPFSLSFLLAPSNGNYSESVGTSVYIWGAHLYRSDLGGMVDNPDQPASRASYVPTTSTAEYLPRIGHHVYNGSAWVNEGLLAESEARTNLIERSNTFDLVWSATGLSSRTANEVGPDGVDNSAYTLTSDTSAGIHANGNTTLFTSGSAHTGSCYFKKGTQRYVKLRAGNTATWPANVTFDLESGVVDTETNGTGTIQEIGNGWYRCSVTATAGATANTNFNIYILNDSKAESYTGTGAETTIVWGAQVEVGSTPSSFIPSDDGTSTVTRAAETFTIPSANLPWPSPNYIGSERLTGSWAVPTGYDNTVSGTGTSVVATGGTTTSRCFLEIDGVDAGEVYQVTLTVNSTSVGNVAVYLRDSSTGSGTILLTQTAIPEGTTFVGHVAAASGVMSALLVGSTGADFDVDISVREIDPLSVSIAMDGRITYADEGATNTATLLYWRVDSENFIRHRLRTDAANVGQLQVMQESNDVNDGKATQYLEPDVLVAYSYATRHGSTFLNLGTDGVSLTANTAPTELVDLSATDLELAQDYMGTVGTFRIWDRDIADTGLVEATNPSLEPSLSLTFEGTGTNSFVVNDWSE